MRAFAWRPLREQWSRELLEEADYRQSLPDEVVASGWLGYPGASDSIASFRVQPLRRVQPLSSLCGEVTCGCAHIAPSSERGCGEQQEEQSDDGGNLYVGEGSLPSDAPDYTVRIWEAATGRLLNAIRWHSHEVHGLSWSPDGHRLASASLDGRVAIWWVG